MPFYPIKPGPELLIDMINEELSSSYVEGDVIFGAPQPVPLTDYNTAMSISFTVPQPGQPRRVTYNRLRLDVITGTEAVSVPDTGVYDNAQDLAPYLSARFNAVILPTDIVSQRFDMGEYPFRITLAAAPGSQIYIGTCLIDFVEESTPLNILTLDGGEPITFNGEFIYLI